jgi:hypothetical protein
MDGWEARVGYPGDEANARPRPIVPAYGVLRALPLLESADHNATVDVVFEYHPASWRRGALTSAGAAALACVLVAFALLKTKNKEAFVAPEIEPCNKDVL